LRAQRFRTSDIDLVPKVPTISTLSGWPTYAGQRRPSCPASAAKRRASAGRQRFILPADGSPTPATRAGD